MRCRRPFILASVVGAATLALLAAGCGGGGSTGVASVASSTTTATTTQSGPVAYSRCMRSHGLPKLSRPRQPRELSLAARLGLSKQTWAPADIACKHLLPNGGNGPQETAQQKATRLADGLSFAKCMRSHGVSRFPDPNAQGELSVEMVEADGVDVHSPAVLHVVQTCLPASHGALTPAKVNEALKNASGG